MKYRYGKNGEALSILGYGCMRFSKKGTGIDIDKAVREVGAAVEQGVNYFDTAYVYQGNEAAVGEVFRRLGCREKINLATKLPHYLLKSRAGIEKIFQEQLRRLKTDYIDYYLIHMLTDLESWEKLLRLGIEDWIQEKKARGQIRNVGFSYHGGRKAFPELVDAYDWDFCMIQYNYMDEYSQAGRSGLQYAAKRGLPVFIMEPLRGGKLVNLLPREAKDLIAREGGGWSAAEWALRWLWDQPEVVCVLSGMNSLEMVEENVRIASSAEAGALGASEFAFIAKVKGLIEAREKVGCTGCGYCMPCPAGVDIPSAFRCYNEMYMEKKATGRREYLQTTAMRKHPGSASLCVGCGKCEAHCPQSIEIRRELKTAAKELETPVYKAFRWAVKRFHLWG